MYQWKTGQTNYSSRLRNRDSSCTEDIYTWCATEETSIVYSQVTEKCKMTAILRGRHHGKPEVSVIFKD